MTDDFTQGAMAMREAATAAQPCTPEDCNENAYDRGYFDGVIDYGKAIRTIDPSTLRPSATNEREKLADEAIRYRDANFSLTSSPSGYQLLTRVAAALRAQPDPVEKWQPISTAPKDGSEILILAHGMVIQARYEPGRWSEDTPNSPAEYDGPVWCGFDDQINFEIEETPDGDFHGPVTHWRPRPPLPERGGFNTTEKEVG